MDRESARRDMENQLDETRLASARWFSDNAETDDLKLLRAARSRERVPRVRTSLEEAIARVIRLEPDSGPARTFSRSTAHTESVGQLCNGIVHELRSVVGSVRAFAIAELGDAYPASRTHDYVESLRQVLAALSTLGDADRVAVIEQVDLAALVEREVAALTEDSSVGPQMAGWCAAHDRETAVLCSGQRPYLVHGDKALLCLALRNGLKNAVESTIEADVPEEVVISWGDSASSYWFSVQDSGVGLPPSPDGIWSFGASTKQGHLGAGMNLVYQASASMDGQVEIATYETATRFFFEWPRADAGGR